MTRREGSLATDFLLSLRVWASVKGSRSWLEWSHTIALPNLHSEVLDDPFVEGIGTLNE